jgi:hypothetical protein
MSTTEYYKQCVSKVRNLKGVLSEGKLTDESLNLLNGQLKVQADNYRPFVSGLSEIIDINDPLKNVLEKVCGEVMSVVDGVYGCDSKIQEIKILRHLHHDDVGIQKGAFIWHSDRHVDELLNVMLYLNDVTKVQHGPFQYIERNGQAYYNNSIAKNITHKEATSYGDVKSLLGEAGSFYVFDNNFLHRASVPTEKDRDAIIFQVRPTRKKQTEFIDLNYIKQPYTSKISSWNRYE